ncbi:MAG: zinc-binding dehydrogenase, partial [Lutispora sp.]|nr:zinc-binding dehydrogenase [Lutispora sp.]
KSLGADLVINPKDVDLKDAILKFNDEEYADAVICSVGGKIPFAQGMEAMAVGARLILLGGTYPPTNVEFDPNVVHYKQTKIIGSVSYTNKGFTNSIKLIADKKLSTKVLQSELIGLEQLEKAFDDVLNAKGLRKCVLFD